MGLERHPALLAMNTLIEDGLVVAQVTCRACAAPDRPRKIRGTSPIFPSPIFPLLQDSGNLLLLSAASVWEIAVKHALGRLPLPNNLTPAEFVPEARSRNSVDSLPITEIDTLQLAKLPGLHQDPFDRMLICQAIANQATIVTPDPLIARYPISVQPT